MILQAQLNRFTGTVVSLALASAAIGGAMVLAPRGASAVEQQIVVTQTSPVFARGIMTRNYRITNPAGQPLQGVALFGSGGPLGNGGGRRSVGLNRPTPTATRPTSPRPAGLVASPQPSPARIHRSLVPAPTAWRGQLRCAPMLRFSSPSRLAHRPTQCLPRPSAMRW